MTDQHDYRWEHHFTTPPVEACPECNFDVRARGWNGTHEELYGILVLECEFICVNCGETWESDYRVGGDWQ